MTLHFRFLNSLRANLIFQMKRISTSKLLNKEMCLYWIKIHLVYDLITYWISWYLLQYEVFASCHACMIWRHLCMDDHVKSKQRKSCNVLLLNHYFYNITPLALSWGKILFCFNYDLIAVFYMDLYALRVHKTNPIWVLYFVFQSSTSMWFQYHIWTSMFTW